MTISSKDVLKKLKDDGWYLVNQVGSHMQFRHPTKKGRVTVNHPVKDMNIKTVRSIENQSGIKML